MSQSVLGRVARGAAWMVLFKVIERSLGLISTLVLVRLLAPGDFGIVAMAMSVVALVELMSAFGFETALIRQQGADRTHYDTVQTLGIAMTASVALLIVLAAPFAAHFYGVEDVQYVLYVLALVPVLAGIQNVGIVAFRKELEFHKEFIFQLTKKLSGFSFRPRPSLQHARAMIAFSKWLFLNNLLGYLRERTTDIFIGRFRGPSGLGIYSISSELANMPTSELSAPINRALLPGLSKVAGDRKQLTELYTTSLSFLALIAVPASAGIHALAHLFVPVMLGSKWLEAIPLIEILALQGVFVVLQSSICSTLTATGHPRDVFVSNAIFVAFLACFLLMLVPQYGLVGAALASAAASALSTPLFLWFMLRRFELSLRWIARTFWRPVAAATIMVSVLRWQYAADAVAPSGGAAILHVLGAVLFGAATYAAGVVALWFVAGRPSGAERILLQRIAHTMGLRR
jgi:lipopolysaccharide exporter